MEVQNMDLLGRNIVNMPLFAKNRLSFQVKRDGHILENTITGFFSSDKNKIQVTKPADVQSGDWLIYEAEKYFVISVSQTPHYYILKYQSEYEHQQNASQTINIQSIGGNAIVGNQQTAIFNIGCTFQEARDLIAQKPIQDQEQLNQLLDRVETAIKENQPISKGSFAYYAGIFDKYSDVALIVSKLISKWVFS